MIYHNYSNKIWEQMQYAICEICYIVEQIVYILQLMDNRKPLHGCKDFGVSFI